MDTNNKERMTKSMDSTPNGTTDQEILLFQLGPVQDFIAQARSTQDLWSGSYMLSWLMAHAIKEVVVKGGLKNEHVIFPALKDNPLVLALRDTRATIDSVEVLIPNLPNRFLMVVPAGKAKELAQIAKNAITTELHSMGEAVWSWLKEQDIHGSRAWRTRWEQQIKAFPQMTYAWTHLIENETWHEASTRVHANLAVRRNTRDFAQWDPVNKEATLKDSLSGKEECIGDEEFWTMLTRKHSDRFKAASHRYGAMNLIKRLWIHVENFDDNNEVNYLADKLNFSTWDVLKKLRMKDLPQIARDNKGTSKYIAVLAFDGDNMGKTMSGKTDNGTLSGSEQQNYATRVSATLSEFALKRVTKIVREEHNGQLIYAGGDDVLALTPADQALSCARALREAFREVGQKYGFEASCGIAVGHQNAPLQMLVREAQRAEKQAKTVYGRAAVAINVYKRSGEIIEWGCKWDGGALDLMAQITELSNAEKLSGRFPYALAALLQPYALNENTPRDSLVNMIPVVQAEVAHVLKRQGETLGAENRGKLASTIGDYLQRCFAPSASGTPTPATAETTVRPQDFINLFFVETFMNRFSREN